MKNVKYVYKCIYEGHDGMNVQSKPILIQIFTFPSMMPNFWMKFHPLEEKCHFATIACN